MENLAALKKKHDRLAKDPEEGSGIAHVFVQEVDASLTWEFLTWLRTVTKLPIYVKAHFLRRRAKWEERIGGFGSKDALDST